jgi:hypothetical protein
MRALLAVLLLLVGIQIAHAQESPPGTTVTTVGPSINASPTPGSAGSGNLITITAGAQIAVNGTVIGNTANVIKLYYTSHTAYQENSALNWYGPIVAGNGGSQVSNPVTSLSNWLPDLSNALAHPTGGTTGFPANKAAYAAHLYPTNVLNQTPDTPLATVVPIWNTYWGTLSNTKPVMVTETGCDCDNSNGQLTDDQNFMNIFTAYVNGTAAGGPVLSGGQQPISTDWYSWGTYAENPNGTLNSNGTIKSGQQTYWTVLLMTGGTIVPPAGRVVPIILGYNDNWPVDLAMNERRRH